MKAGGKREGAGRPKAAPTRVTRIRLLVPDDDALQTLGGADYAKAQVVKAIRRDIKEANQLKGE